ncbi:hypothetical protein R6Q57_001810 [Mikania cordata]
MAPLQKSKSVSQADQLQIQHSIHQHVLHKMFMTSEFNCDGCNTGGYGVRYRCSACEFDLHEQCAVARNRISASHLHPHHHLILVNRPGDSHLCHVCKGVTNGLSYTCEIHACEFNVHTLCIQIPVTNHNHNHNNQPVLINHQQPMMVSRQQPIRVSHQQPMTVNHQQPTMVNNQQPMVVNSVNQPMQGMQLGGYNNQTHMQQQGPPMTGFAGGYNPQPAMVNHHHQQLQPKQGVPTTAFGGYLTHNHMISNHQQPQMMTNHHQQQLMTNHHHQQQQLMANHHQQQVMPTGVGGYNVVNNNQTVMISQPPPPPPPPPPQSNGYTKVGKLAANILSTSLIGIPLFNSRN